MQNKLLQAFASIVPRETSGSETAARYDFQTHVCIVKLLSLHEAGESFCAFFDYLDDLLILDSAVEPTSARFYQVKAKASGNWTTHALCKEEGEQAPKSIISRMYLNIDALKEMTSSVGFISNAQFKVKLLNGKDCDGAQVLISGTELHATAVEKLKAAVAKDFDEPLFAGWSDLIVLERFSHGTVDQDIFVKGKLVKHLEHFEQADHVPVSALYEVLYNAVRVRIGNVDKSQDFASLLKSKALTSSEFDALFDTAVATRPSVMRDWSVISAELAASLGSLKAIRLKTVAVSYIRQCKGGAALAAQFSDAALGAIKANVAAFEACNTIVEAIDLMRTLLSDQVPELQGLDREGALLVESYGAVHHGAAE